MGLTHFTRVVQTSPVTNVTASSVTIDRETHGGQLITINAAAGCAVTLPAATGSGYRFEFIIGTTITSNSTTIKVVGDDVMVGYATLLQDAADTAVHFETAGTSDTITMNGSTTGGIAGARIVLTDIAADKWHVDMKGAATGTEATPFSATVS